MAMSLDGLRAWIGVVERKLTMRTRVFIVLVAIAVGGAGAAIYLAVDAQNNSVSKADVEAVRDELAGTTGGGNVSPLEAEIEALRSEVDALREEGGTGSQGPSASPTNPSGGVAPGSAGGAATAPKSDQQLRELVERAKEEAEK